MTPDKTFSEFRRAQRLLENRDPAAAARVLAGLVDEAPNDLSILELYARALFASAQLGRAEAALRKLVERAPDDGWARFALARNLERLHRGDEAIEHRRIAQALGVTG